MLDQRKYDSRFANSEEEILSAASPSCPSSERNRNDGDTSAVITGNFIAVR